MKDALLINSYAGSILSACVDLKVPIRGSCETNGYGLEVQKFNVPGVRYFANTAEWPKENLKRSLVIGHPPCSAFSTLNTPMRRKNSTDGTASVSSKAFQCTRDLLSYAHGQGAEMIMIESVPKALKEAREVHEKFADDYGYSLVRILQSASCFGLAQNRKRFWAVFAKEKGRSFTITIPDLPAPPLSEVIKGEGAPFSDHVRQFDGYAKRLMERAKDESVVKAMFHGEYGYGKIKDIVAHMYAANPTDKTTDDEVFGKYVVANRWAVSSGTILDPRGLAPVVLACSLWMMNGKPLTLKDYTNLMGFPDWYRFPERIVDNSSKVLGYLSRGVCPPIVQWLVSQFAPELVNVERKTWGTELITVADGQIVDFTEKRRKVHDGVERAPRPRTSTSTANDGFNDLAPAPLLWTPDDEDEMEA